METVWQALTGSLCSGCKPRSTELCSRPGQHFHWVGAHSRQQCGPRRRFVCRPRPSLSPTHQAGSCRDPWLSAPLCTHLRHPLRCHAFFSLHIQRLRHCSPLIPTGTSIHKWYTNKKDTQRVTDEKEPSPPHLRPPPLTASLRTQAPAKHATCEHTLRRCHAIPSPH